MEAFGLGLHSFLLALALLWPFASSLLLVGIALGTNMGLGRMGEISDVNYQDLQGAYRNFFRMETLKEANDLIANATAQLPVFRHYGH